MLQYESLLLCLLRISHPSAIIFAKMGEDREEEGGVAQGVAQPCGTSGRDHETSSKRWPIVAWRCARAMTTSRAGYWMLVRSRESNSSASALPRGKQVLYLFTPNVLDVK